MPKTGPSEGSRSVATTRFPIRSSPWVRLIETTVFPSPALVGVIAVTSINLPDGLKAGSVSRSSLTFADCSPYGTT